MENFKSFNLPESLNHILAHLKYDKPTPIQAQAIPSGLEGKDVLASAQTGTGKTAAFSIPLVVKLMNSSEGSALVITPTRELAAQVLSQIQNLLGSRSSIKTALLIGGESMTRQLQKLKNRPRVIVGTPGRINDHLERKTLKLGHTKFLVLDETDRMLDMGFSVQIDRILKFLPKSRQTMLFSATLPKNIMDISKKYLTNPVRIAVSEDSRTPSKIKQEIINITQDSKYGELLNQLNKRSGSVIMFMKTKFSTEKMAKKLLEHGFTACAIHGDLRQGKRDKVIKDFRNNKYRILVATDVAARGLDIPHIEHVINFDLPQCPEDYIHRIGRTARAGAEGSALCFITPSDKGKWKEISTLLDPNQEVEKSEIRTGRPKDNRKPKKSSSSFAKSKPQSFGENRRSFLDKRKDRDGEYLEEKKPFGKKPLGQKKFVGNKKKFGAKDEFEGTSTFKAKKPFGSKKPFSKFTSKSSPKPFKKKTFKK
ncbi:MAG: DEAD/DEAH box helicase [Rickettsiales bacterium]|nr:DEAD/DEAH box helicase [Rickettsiales bacterium]